MPSSKFSFACFALIFHGILSWATNFQIFCRIMATITR